MRSAWADTVLLCERSILIAKKGMAGGSAEYGVELLSLIEMQMSAGDFGHEWIRPGGKAALAANGPSVDLNGTSAQRLEMSGAGDL
jgi:hypothetical protein